MPPPSQTKIDVGTVSSPGCSNTIAGFLRSPTISQILPPNARAPPIHSFWPAPSVQCGGMPQWLNSRAVDVAGGAERDAVLALLGARDDRDRDPAGVLHELDRLRAEAAGAAPDENDVALLHGVALPAEEHPVGGRADERRRRRLLPGQVVGLRHALVPLGDRELPEGAVVGAVVAPDVRARRDHRVLARLDPRVVALPPAVVDHDLVADLHVVDVLADRVDDPGGVAAADVEVLASTPAFWRVAMMSIGIPRAAHTLL